jgi:hypothetical protein
MTILTICLTALACTVGGLAAYGCGYLHGVLEAERRSNAPITQRPVAAIAHVRGSRRASIILGTPWLAGRAS